MPAPTLTAPFEFLPLGAIIQTFMVGNTNIVQGFPKQSLYELHNTPYFGETIGRIANRIKDAKIDSLNGKSYSLAVNDGANSLHGGIKGWGKRTWTGPLPVGSKVITGLAGSALEDGGSVVFKLKSEDGDEGYPGDVEASVLYTVGTQKTQDGKTVTVLGIEYQVELVGGAEETVVSLTNHSYFNLTGDPTIEGTQVELVTDMYLPCDDGIPTGGLIPHPVGKSCTLGATEPAFDDCFALPSVSPSSVPIDTRSEPLNKLVAAYHPKSGIHFEALSTEPAFQFYTGSFIDVPAVDGVAARGPRSGFCVEPSRYVNAANIPEWKGQVLLKKGQVYGSRIVYRAWNEKE